MKAKCLCSIELPLPHGGFHRFEVGTVYDVSDLDDATIKAYFEEPLKSPPKGLQTRTADAGGGS